MSAPRLALAATHGEIGGGEVMLLAAAESLRRIGLDVLVLAPRNPGALVAEARRRGMATIPLGGSGRLSYLAALAAWRLRNPRLPLWCHGLLPAVATAGIGPRLVHLHQQPRGHQRHLLAPALRGARRVLVPSAFLAQRLPGSTVLPNWTEPLPFRPVRELPAAGAVPRLGFLGRVTPDKGVEELARAVTRLTGQSDQPDQPGQPGQTGSVPGPRARPVELVIAGETRFVGPRERDAVERALAPLAPLTRRLGWIPRERFAGTVDVAVFPSVWEEPFGLVVAEAMAAGVPFVVSDAGALPEVAGPGYPWVARAGDADDLARVIAELLSAGPEQRDRTARAARSRWEELYSPQAGDRRVQDLLSGLDRPVTPHGRYRGRR